MAVAKNIPQLGVLQTVPIDPSSKMFVWPWNQFFQSLWVAQQSAPQGYSVTSAQRLKLVNVNTGSIAFETDTSHVYTWSGTAWVRLV